MDETKAPEGLYVVFNSDGRPLMVTEEEHVAKEAKSMDGAIVPYFRDVGLSSVEELIDEVRALAPGGRLMALNHYSRRITDEIEQAVTLVLAHAVDLQSRGHGSDADSA